MDLTQPDAGVVLDDATTDPTSNLIAPEPPAEPAGESVIPEGEPEAEAAPAEEEAPPEPKRRSMVDDLRAERQARREAVARAQELEARMRSAEPLLEAVVSNPQLLAQIMQQQGVPQAQAAPPEPQVDPRDLAALAQDLGLYDARGQLDLKTAERVYLRQASVAQRAAAEAAEQAIQRHVAPVQQSMETQQAQGVVQHLMAFGEQNGVPSALVAQVASALPPGLLLQPNVGNLVLAVAAGLQRLQGGEGAPAPQPQPRQVRQAQAEDAPPLFTESVRQRTPVTTLDAPFQKILHDRGLTDGDITKTLKNWRSDAPIRLE